MPPKHKTPVYHWKHGWIPLDHEAAAEAKKHGWTQAEISKATGSLTHLPHAFSRVDAAAAIASAAHKYGLDASQLRKLIGEKKQMHQLETDTVVRAAEAAAKKQREAAAKHAKKLAAAAAKKKHTTTHHHAKAARATR